MTARDKFNGIEAEFWDCKDDEHLTHLDPISALEDLVESHLDRTTSAEEQIREMGSITCEAYRREKISDEHIEEATDRALDRARESLDEDSGLGDPEGELAMFTLDALAKHRTAFEVAVRELVADATVRHFEIVRSVQLTPDETIEILRGERPEWFAPEFATVEGSTAAAVESFREAIDAGSPEDH